VPLIIWPSLVSTLLRVDSPQYAGVANASLEQYFARSLGLSQLALAGLLLVLSGALPLDSIVEGPLPPHPPLFHAPPHPNTPQQPTPPPPPPPPRPPSSSRPSTTPPPPRTPTRATTPRAASWPTCSGAWAAACWRRLGCGCSYLRATRRSG
jgi:hypothetical protein